VSCAPEMHSQLGVTSFAMFVFRHGDHSLACDSQRPLLVGMRSSAVIHAMHASVRDRSPKWERAREIARGQEQGLVRQLSEEGWPWKVVRLAH